MSRMAVRAIHSLHSSDSVYALNTHIVSGFGDNCRISVDNSANMCTSVSFLWLKHSKKSLIHTTRQLINGTQRCINMPLC